MIGTRLGPYEITAKLGEGGMGVVFKAKDFQLGREVALKVLPEGFTQDPERLARFEREAKLLAQLNHPNIAQVYGLEVSGDTRALVMELVEGPTLAERLEKGSLPLDESLSIARQISEALEEAHEKGIVHRDLKPQNIKASIEGKVKVLDFGLAKAMDPAGSSAALPADLAHSPTVTFGGTLEGVILGTAAYMAPEQARGAAVDKRADIWAFGVVLYEMLTGERLFAEASVVDTLSAVMRKEIDLGKVPATIPIRLRELVGRCLERDPKRRLRDIGEARLLLAEGLARESAAAPAQPATASMSPARATGVGARIGAAVAIALLVVVTVAILLLRDRESSASRATETIAAAVTDRSIAVLPFQNLSAEAENAFFAAGVHEDVLTYLSRIADLKVISRSSVMQYAAPEKNLREIAADLGVVYVVEGSVRRANDRVRVTAQLIDARTDEHVWAETYDRDLADVFAIQTAIAREIVGALEASLSPREAELLASRPTSSIEAYDLYLQARQRTRMQDTQRAFHQEGADLLERALRLDPRFAHAHALLASLHGYSYWWADDRTPERLARMKQAIDRAFELRPGLPEAHLALAEYHYRGFFDYPRALEQLELARQLMPNDSLVQFNLGLTYRRLGLHDRSLDSFEQAIRLDPAGLAAYAEAVDTAYATGRVARGLAIGEAAERRFPRSGRIAGDMASLFLTRFGDISKARSLLDEAEPAQEFSYFNAAFLTALYERSFLEAASIAREPYFADSIARGWGTTLAAQALALGGFEDEAQGLMREAEEILVAEVAKPYAQNYGFPHMAYAIDLALLERTSEAVERCNHATSVLPLERDHLHGAYFRQECAWVLAMAGRTDEALAEIAMLLEHGYYLTRWRLKLDPRWDFLREDPRFRELSTPKPAEAAK